MTLFEIMRKKDRAYRGFLADIEAELIADALNASTTINAAAKLLGLKRTTLSMKIIALSKLGYEFPLEDQNIKVRRIKR